jgi:hypothetical protein
MITTKFLVFFEKETDSYNFTRLSELINQTRFEKWESFYKNGNVVVNYKSLLSDLKNYNFSVDFFNNYDKIIYISVDCKYSEFIRVYLDFYKLEYKEF